MSDHIYGIFSNADIIAFSHTGHTFSDNIPDLPGFKCVSCSVRPYAAIWGGVAVFVRPGFSVESVQDLPEFGMSWFHIRHLGVSVHACICYLPHEHSSYLKREDGRLSAEAHYEALNMCVSKYRALGEVLIMGDMNARTACVDDRCDITTLHEWQGLDVANIPIPHDLINSFAHMHKVCDRNSCDAVSNRNGGLLIDLCRNQGLLILNGRLSGDSDGVCTYFQHGRPEASSSLIDYFISTPSLCFDDLGKDKSGTYLHVYDPIDIPPRPSGGKFDHVPIIVSVPWFKLKVIKPVHQEATGVRVFKWQNEYRDKYVNYLLTLPKVSEHLHSVHSSACIESSAQSFFFCY